MVEESKRATRSDERFEQACQGPCQPTRDLMDYLRHYAREKPAMVAGVCLGVGFLLGWKLKPW